MYHIINNTETYTISCAHACKNVFTDINGTKVFINFHLFFFRKVVYEVYTDKSLAQPGRKQATATEDFDMWK